MSMQEVGFSTDGILFFFFYNSFISILNQIMLEKKE